MQTMVEILTQARVKLTPTTWLKNGSWFQTIDNTICMCAHGAVQSVINPECQLALTTGSIKSADDIARNSGGEFCAQVGRQYTAGQQQHLTQDALINHHQAWERRSQLTYTCWYSAKRSHASDAYGAHYLLGMVGLTIGFNDDSQTTHEMVMSKFDEAIELAKELGV